MKAMMPGMFSKHSSIFHWNSSRENFKSNSNQRYLYLPSGELNVVRYEDSLVNGMVKYPHLISSLVNNFAPDDTRKVSSKVFIG